MSKQILVIDDEELITKTLSSGLEKLGYGVLVAKNGDDAIVMAEEEEFNLIICDLKMPGLNGVETIKSIRDMYEKKGSPDIPLIFITGYADPDLEKAAKGLNPKAYFNKPFDFQMFTGEVKAALES